MELYCVLCGEMLQPENSSLVCLGCDAEYSNVLLSESRVDSEDKTITEMSISMDFASIKQKVEKNSILERGDRTAKDYAAEKGILAEVM